MLFLVSIQGALTWIVNGHNARLAAVELSCSILSKQVALVHSYARFLCPLGHLAQHRTCGLWNMTPCKPDLNKQLCIASQCVPTYSWPATSSRDPSTGLMQVCRTAK
jgi:hypothetical protein